MKEEEQIVVDLSIWLDRAGFDVYWNKKNPLFHHFRVKGDQKKPDLLIRRRNHPTWYNSVIEVKPGNGGKIRSGAKILDYWRLSVTDKTQYFVNEQEVCPKYFLVATQFSPDGKLFESDTSLKPLLRGSSRAIAIDYGVIPPNEYTQTSNYVRQLWATWRDVYKRVPGTAVGVLLSDILNRDGIGNPAFMYQEYKEKWSQRWRSFQ